MAEYLFFRLPDFCISKQEELEAENVPELALVTWKQLIRGNRDFVSNHNLTSRYSDAKFRYISLYPMISIYQEWKYIRLIVAESLFWLSRMEESLKLLLELSKLISGDEKLETIIQNIRKLLEKEVNEDEHYHNTKGKEKTCEFTSPQLPIWNNDPHSVEALQAEWKSLQNKEAAAIELFTRYACLTSNILEGVFEVEGQSWSRLVRVGFYANSIEGISATSKQKKKKKIVAILENTQDSLSSISECLDNTDNFTTDFIKKIHKLMLKSDNFDEETEDYAGTEYPVIRLMRVGEYRTVACITQHNEIEPGKYGLVTQYCHHSKIPDEMETFCKTAREILKDDKAPLFMKVSWLQWAFLRIHPFEDGNGRVARIISSIPLYKYKLPPIVVTSEDKCNYYKALQRADDGGEYFLNSLCSVLYEALSSAIYVIKNLPDSTSSISTTGIRRSPTPSESSSEENSDEN